jgi:glycosyltransferase involved in cell wall biosynthesis
MPDKAKVSILMNCYNGEKYLREAVDSVLAQTYKHFELIFWDNCSSDSSAEIFNSYPDERLRYFLAPEHTDLGGGRAKAWEYLSGEFVAVLDADDVWLPSKLERQLPYFSDPEVGIVISDTLFFNEVAEKPLYAGKYPPEGWVFENLLKEYFVSLETLIIRRSAAQQLPRAFDADFSAIADFDLVVRLSRVSKLAVVPEILAKWRVHADSDTWRYPLSFVEEKDRWIAKQISEDPVFYGNHANAVEMFRNKNIRTKVIHLLRHKHGLTALKELLKSKFDHWHAWALLTLCLFPFAGSMLDRIVKRRTSLQ